MKEGLWEGGSGWPGAWPFIWLQKPRCQRNTGSDRNCHKKELGSETGTLPLSIHFCPQWEGCREVGGQGGEQGKGLGSFLASVPINAALHHTVY